jgi:hypothetical protein
LRVGASFIPAGQIFHFFATTPLSVDDDVVVETEHGPRIARV